jgi:hypothetical protein
MGTAMSAELPPGFTLLPEAPPVEPTRSGVQQPQGLGAALPSGFTLLPDQAADPYAEYTKPQGDQAMAPEDWTAANNRLNRFGTGMADPAVGAGQLLVHGSKYLADQMGIQKPELNQRQADVDAAIAEREKAIQVERQAPGSNPGGTDWYRIAGNVASPANVVLGLFQPLLAAR